MERDVRRRAKLARFKSIRPRTVRMTERELVTAAPLDAGHGLPLVIRPAVEDLDAIGWAQAQRAWIEARLLEHGALLFRGFPLATTADFERLAQAVCDSELFGEYGDLPHEKLGAKLYGATPYPPDRMILFHNESSHLHRWPMKQFFFCVQAAVQGGETPIVDCREVYRRLPPQLQARFERDQLLYVRRFGEGLDVSWQDFFHTTEWREVEARCRQAGIDFEWTAHDGLRTRELRPAVARHPRTGEPVFFNQLQLHHASCLEAGLRESLLTMLGEAGLPRNVYCGDGSPIEDAVVAKVRALYEQLAVGIPWQAGDALMLDNMLVAHARRPYRGPRKLVVALGEMITQAELDQAAVEHQALKR